MRQRIYILPLLFCLLHSAAGMAQEAKTKTDTGACYPWLCPQFNYIQFYDAAVLKSFSDKWNSSHEGLISIAHFGDSHVQPDVYPGALRRRLQMCKGDAGFGMLFPFSTAKTYSMVDYRSVHTGTWTNSKSIEHRPSLPLGISGATANTKDSNAGFTIIFKQDVPAQYRKLKIFCKQEHCSYAMRIRGYGRDTLVKVDSIDPNNFVPYIPVTLPAVRDSITVQMVKTDTCQHEFEIYGLSLESTDPEGVMLHCMGIGGSQYASVLWEDLFDYQLPGIKPDLAILDFGTNDFLYDNTVPADLESQIVQVIQKVRRDAPECTVLLTTAMDMNYRGRNVSAGKEFSKLIHKIAKEQKCPFYDWYWVAGGPHKMDLWHDNGLSQNDMVHLKAKGSELKGDLFADAFINTMAMMVSPYRPDSLIFPVPDIKDSVPIAPFKREEHAVSRHSQTTAGSRGYITYKVQKGDNLGRIAIKYHTTIAFLQKLNKMKGTAIVAGKTIKVPGEAPAKQKSGGRKKSHRRRH